MNEDIAALERAVVEAAEAWNASYDPDQEHGTAWKSRLALKEAVDALRAARRPKWTMHPSNRSSNPMLSGDGTVWAVRCDGELVAEMNDRGTRGDAEKWAREFVAAREREGTQEAPSASDVISSAASWVRSKLPFFVTGDRALANRVADAMKNDLDLLLGPYTIERKP